MTTPTPGRTWVQPPQVEPYMYGLLSVASTTDGGGHWQIGGVEYYSDACAQGGHVIGSCPRPVPTDETRGAVITGGTTTVPWLFTVSAPGTPRDFVMAVDEAAPGPVTVNITPPAGAVSIAVLQPGEVFPFTAPDGIDGTWTLSSDDLPGCSVTFTVPITEEGTLGVCEGSAYRPWLQSDDNSNVTVSYVIINPDGEPVASGALAPGEREAPDVYLPPGAYTVEFTADGLTDPVEAELVIPDGDLLAEVIVPNDGATTHDKPIYDGLTPVHSSPPFTVYNRAECLAVGFDQPSEVARRRLAMVENREVEKFFSRYVLGDPAVVQINDGDPTDIATGIGLLEQHAALHYGGRPVLHAPRWTYPWFTYLEIVQDIQSARTLLRTAMESRIAFGAGYYDNPFDPGTPLPEGQFWLVATGSVRAWRSEVFVHEAFDGGHPNPAVPTGSSSSNLRVAIAERTYVLDADCYRAAVLISIQTPPAVTP